jgi:hypothetical protein
MVLLLCEEQVLWVLLLLLCEEQVLRVLLFLAQQEQLLWVLLLQFVARVVVLQFVAYQDYDVALSLLRLQFPHLLNITYYYNI